ncbi:MAG TPA: tetratricopeptide repeat protein [Thermoanaerobaculia bacterium]|nr:tetratricopeptide repeat protein [Thermoanaerobaculia bacterium]
MTRTKTAAAVSVGAMAIVLLWYFVAEPYRANLTKREVAAITNAALLGPEREAAAMARENLQRLQRLSYPSVLDPEIHVLKAANYRVLRRYQEAIAAYDEALRLEPTAHIYLNRGVTQLAAGRPEAAHESFSRAVRFDRSLAAEAMDAEQTYRSMLPRP